MTPYSDIRKKLIGATICCFIVGGGQGLVAQKVIFPPATAGQHGVARCWRWHIHP